MIYVVSYDLAVSIFRDVSPFLKELQDTGAGRSWWHFLINTWLISTPENAQGLFDRLQKHLKPDDRLLIMRVDPEYSGWLPQEAWQWIRERESAGSFTFQMPVGAAAVGF